MSWSIVRSSWTLRMSGALTGGSRGRSDAAVPNLVSAYANDCDRLDAYGSTGPCPFRGTNTARWT